MEGFESQAQSTQGVQFLVGVPTEPPTSFPVAEISAATPPVIKFTGAPVALDEGDQVTLSGTGKVALDGKKFVLTNAVDPTLATQTFELAPSVNGAAWGAPITTGTATQSTYLPLCETKTFTGFDGQASEMDVTTICSEAKEYRLGLQDFGAFSFEMNYVANDPATMALQNAKATAEVLPFQLILPDGAGAWLFNAYVRQLTIAGGVDQPLTSSVVLRITGAPVFVEGPGPEAALASAPTTTTPPGYRQPALPKRQERVAA